MVSPIALARSSSLARMVRTRKYKSLKENTYRIIIVIFCNKHALKFPQLWFSKKVRINKITRLNKIKLFVFNRYN